jgi:AcrR family transcriptional regulator
VSTEPALDRRQRRRLETIEEVLDVAVEVMTEQGVAGLSLGEVARRMGIQTPSLYVYFPSKAALYDALFARGNRLLLATMERFDGSGEARGATLEERLLAVARAFLGWCLSNRAYAQLLFWRPVPGFTPSQQAYAPAVQMLDNSRRWLTGLRDERLLRADVPIDEALRDWTVLLSGVFSQQASNAPHDDLDSGWFTAALPGLVAMFARHYGRPTPPPPPRRSARHVHSG